MSEIPASRAKIGTSGKITPMPSEIPNDAAARPNNPASGPRSGDRSSVRSRTWWGGDGVRSQDRSVGVPESQRVTGFVQGGFPSFRRHVRKDTGAPDEQPLDAVLGVELER